MMENISIEDKQRLWDLLESIIEKLGQPSEFCIDTHGLVMLRLHSVAATLKANPGIAHTIYYDRNTKEVYTCENAAEKIPDDVDLLSSNCPYVCLVPRGQTLTEQEIADRVWESVERNICIALIESKYKFLANHEKIEFLFTREEGNP